MYRLAIFDLDGTLLDTIKDLSTACNVALAHFGYKQHPVEAYKYFAGNGIYKLIERAMPEEKRTKTQIEEVKAEFDRYYSTHSLDFTKPYEGMIELLESLKAADIDVAVLSNKPHAYTKELVERFFDHCVSKALGQREGIPVKPHPVGIEELLLDFKMPKEESIYIGDSDVDMFTAQAAKVTSVGVLWGFRKAEELTKAGANYLASDPKVLKDIILLD